MPAAVPFLVAALGEGGFIVAMGALKTLVITAAVSAALGSYEKSRQERKARDAYNASLQDRLITVRSGVSTRKYVLGTHRVGGTLMYAESIGPNQTALDTIIAMAANRCQVVGYYFGDEYVSLADFPGEKYGHRDVFSDTQMVSGDASSGHVDVTITLPNDPIPGSMSVGAAGLGEGSEGWSAELVSTSGRSVTVRLVGGSYVVGRVAYSYYGASKLRVLFKDGDHNQVTSSWSDYASPLWTENHRLRGVAYLRTLMLWDENIYASGAPEISAVLKGWGEDSHLIYDPRLGYNVAYSDNPAILAAWWMTLPRRLGGCGYQQDWIDWEAVKVAANICDELIAVRTLDGSGYEQIKRYQCHTVLDTAAAPIDNRNAILRSMAGKVAFTNGKYRIVAGAYRPPTLTLSDNDLVGAEAIEMVAAGDDSAPPNIITARFSDATKAWVESSPPPVRNDAYVTSDGAEVSEDLDLSCTTDPRQANYLQGVALEERRPRFTVNLKVGGIGENIALLDVVELDITNRPSYGGRALEVIKWSDNWDGTFSLTLAEIKASTYALDADRFTPTNPAPIPDLSYLWNVAAVDGFTASLGTPQLMPDGTSMTRVELAWSAHSQSYVRQTGRIEIRYRQVGTTAWADVAATAGDSTGTVFSAGLVNTAAYEFQARARNGLGAISPWVSTFAIVNGEAVATPAIRLDVSSSIFRVSNGGSGAPATVTFTPVLSGPLAGPVTWAVVGGSATLTGTGDTRTLAFSGMATDVVTVQVSATHAGTVFTARNSVVKIYDGLPGDPGDPGDPGAPGDPGDPGPPAVNAVLSRNPVVLPADSAGAVTSYTGATSTMAMYVGTENDSGNWTYTRVNGSGVSSTLAGNVLTITSMAQATDASYVDITATRAGFSSVTARLGVNKSKQGAPGTAGQAGARGSVQIAAATTATTWSDSAANAALVAMGYSGPAQLDMVTLYNTAAKWSEARVYVSGQWLPVAAYINGNLIVSGTVASEALSATTLSAIRAILGDVSAGSLRNGSFTGWAWPAAGGSGFYLGPNGLLMGDWNGWQVGNGHGFVYLTADGQFQVPGMSVINGVLSISQANVIDTLQLKGQSVSFQGWSKETNQVIYNLGGSSSNWAVPVAQVAHSYSQYGGPVVATFTFADPFIFNHHYATNNRTIQSYLRVRANSTSGAVLAEFGSWFSSDNQATAAPNISTSSLAVRIDALPAGTTSLVLMIEIYCSGSTPTIVDGLISFGTRYASTMELKR